MMQGLTLGTGLALCLCLSSCAADHGSAAADDTTRIERGNFHVAGLATPPGQLDLPYLRYRRGESDKPTLFFLGGGPGVSNLKFTPPQEWLADFDVVILEYRGVGESSYELDSGHFLKALKVSIPRLGLQEAAPMQKAFRAGFDELRRKGVVFDEFSVSALADDVENLRRQLGLSRIYLVAHSFGTRVALNYQTRYRERAAASMLFAMNTPGGFLWYPEQTQSVWRRYQEKLAPSNELKPALGRLLEQAPRRADSWGPFAIDDAKAMVVAFFLSFNRGSRDQAFRAMDLAQDGSAFRWWGMAYSYDWIVRFGFNWADFFVKAYTADCDRQALARVDAQGRTALFQSPSAVLFSAIDAFEDAGGRCVAQAEQPDYQRTLAVFGEFDPSTPLEGIPQNFPREQLLVVPGAGHADTLYGNGATTALWLRRFFLKDDTKNTP